MKPTEELLHEHEAIESMLQILEEVCTRLSAGTDVVPDDIGKMLEFFKVFADRCHHHKEEDLLFPALEMVGVGRERGPIGVMLIEHDLGRKYIAGMTDALGQYRNDRSRGREEFVRNARAYIHLLGMHIQKENMVLFPLADERLSPAAQQKLSTEFAAFEAEQIGEEAHAEFHRLIKSLKVTYQPEERV